MSTEIKAQTYKPTGAEKAVLEENEKKELERIDDEQSQNAPNVNAINNAPELNPVNASNAPEKHDPYKPLFDILNANTPETEAERRRRERKEKRAKLFAAIGDGIGALSNLYFASQGAPNADVSKNTMSSKVQNRIEKLQKERDARNTAYANAYSRINQMKSADEQNIWERDYKKEALKLRKEEEERRQMQTRQYDRKQDWLEKYQAGILDIKNEELKIKRDLAAGVISKREADAAANALRAQAAIMNARTNRMKAGGSTVETSETVTDPILGDTQKTVTKTTTPNGQVGSNASQNTQNSGKQSFSIRGKSSTSADKPYKNFSINKKK